MKRRNKKSILHIKFVSDSLFVILGLAVMLLFMILLAVIMSVVSIPYKITVMLAEFSLCFGCFISSFCYLLYVKRHGIFNGFINSAKIYAIVFITGLIITDSISLTIIPLRMSAALLSGMVGGIYGVNSRLRKPL